MSGFDGLNEQHVHALWNRAEAAGMPRRRFLAILAAGGATAVLTSIVSCAPLPAPPPAAPPAPPSPAPSPPPPTAPATPPRLIQKPLPGQFFIPLGTNAEMRFELLANRAYVVPNSFFFVRSHTSTPVIDVNTWKLSISGDGVEKPFEVNYDDLLKLPSKTVTRFIECAGNGRSFFTSLLNRPAEGGQWRLGAYGVAEWTGVQLSELLRRAGIKRTAVDVMPTGLDTPPIERPIPVAKAMEDDTIVAYLMNGEILPLDHGFPARVLVPGWVGISSIKWVGKITVSEKPIFVEKNTTNYVLIGPDYEPQPPAKGPAVTTQVLKSACCLPWPATLTAGPQKIIGYAWSPFGRISRVEVSLDGGRTFRDAALVGPNVERGGSRWEFSFDAQPGDMTITPRATDDKNNTQYAVSQQKWNQLGYLFGAMVPHTVRVV